MKDLYIELSYRYCSDDLLISNSWQVLVKHYSEKHRHYHNLTHIKHLIDQLSKVKDSISDWDCVLFAAFYHDSIYKVTSKNNEELSAKLAVKHLQAYQVPEDKISHCTEHIIATKNHDFAKCFDSNLFTDADLAILGQPWDGYENYIKAIRKEYAIYPDIVYKPGRKKVLEHFLAMDTIFKTPYFTEKYELIARENIRKELVLLG